MRRKNELPRRNGVANVPVVMQMEALECGAACLCMVLGYYGKWVPLEQAREDCGVSRNGANALNVVRAARAYGLKATGYRCEPAAFRKHGEYPCIVHWNFNHFVVLKGFRRGYAYINDPERGSMRVSMETFDRSFTGICLKFSPSEAFTPSGKPKSVYSFAARRLKGTSAAIAFTIITGVTAALIGIIRPAFSRIFLDHLLTGKNPDWFPSFIVFLAGLNLLQITASAVSAVYGLRIRGKMAAVGNSAFMWKVLRLPQRFFSQRMAGDIQSRQSSNAAIAVAFVQTFAPLFLNAVMIAFYLAVMLRYSWVLTLIGLSSLALNALISQIISRKRANLTRVSMRDRSKLASSTVSGIDMIETVKAAGAENGYFEKWSGYQANVNAHEVHLSRLQTYLGMLPQLITALANHTVTALGVYYAMQGRFTVGMVMAFQGFLSAIMAPAQSFITAGGTLQEMRTQMDRMNDVMEYPDDRVFDESPASGESHKLTGNVEIRGLTFGYSPLDEPIIRNFSLSVAPGRSVAIVGRSGCGKSTVSKLISGLYTPWSGEILFDGKPMREIRKSVFRASLAVVDQDVILFEDTVANNIKMWDDSIEDFEMILAARDAQIHDDIMARPMGYQHRIIEDGRDFSGGQRQRLEIARVLAQDPTIVIMDEATSALDAQTEAEVVEAIRDRGIACIVIAHRLSTVRESDEIIVLEKGEIVGRGTHDELMASCEIYRTLVSEA